MKRFSQVAILPEWPRYLGLGDRPGCRGTSHDIRLGIDLAGRTGNPAPPHLKVGFDEFEYGFVYRRIQEGMSEDNPLWTVGRTCLWPNALYTGDHCEWRVPIDDRYVMPSAV